MSEAPPANGVGDHGVHELHDGRLVGGLAQLDHLGLVLLVVQLVHGPLERPELLDQRGDVLRRGDGAAHFVAGRHRDVVERQQVGRVGRGHEQGALGKERDRHRLVAARLLAVEHARGALVHVEGVQVHVVEAVALRERLGELAGVDDAGVDQCLAERHAVAAPALHDPLHELPLGETELHDDVTNASFDACALGGRDESWNGKRPSRGSRSFHTPGVSAGTPSRSSFHREAAWRAVSRSGHTRRLSTMSAISNTREIGPGGQTIANP